MEEMIKRKIINGYAGSSLQDIYNFINEVHMENLITSKVAKTLMSWAEDYRKNRRINPCIVKKAGIVYTDN